MTQTDDAIYIYGGTPREHEGNQDSGRNRKQYMEHDLKLTGNPPLVPLPRRVSRSNQIRMQTGFL